MSAGDPHEAARVPPGDLVRIERRIESAHLSNGKNSEAERYDAWLRQFDTELVAPGEPIRLSDAGEHSVPVSLRFHQSHPIERRGRFRLDLGTAMVGLRRSDIDFHHVPHI